LLEASVPRSGGFTCRCPKPSTPAAISASRSSPNCGAS
jgi:hypothetical protein